VRIIAGDRRGAKIAAPKGDTTRPTGDRVREAAYNLIGPVDDTAVLDLFAGSGAMGLEALSRGARRCVFVETDRAACEVISGNLEKLRLTGALVLQKDAFQALREERGAGRTYDLVLVDPPYGAWPELQSRVAESVPPVLAPDGVVVVETSARVEPELPLTLVTSRRYGSARITLFTR
jgi:16S rRNA (guanine966-N2)-methyltransferase